jgi:hypothetical protein
MFLWYITCISLCVNCTPGLSIKFWKIKWVTYVSISVILKIILWLASVYGYIDLPGCCSLSRMNEIISEVAACVWYFDIFWQLILIYSLTGVGHSIFYPFVNVTRCYGIFPSCRLIVTHIWWVNCLALWMKIWHLTQHYQANC